MTIIYLPQSDYRHETSQETLPEDSDNVIAFSLLNRKQRAFIRGDLYGRIMLSYLQPAERKGLQRLPLMHKVRTIFGSSRYKGGASLALRAAQNIGFVVSITNESDSFGGRVAISPEFYIETRAGKELSDRLRKYSQ